jgi:hypothetical protein
MSWYQRAWGSVKAVAPGRRRRTSLSRRIFADVTQLDLHLTAIGHLGRVPPLIRFTAGYEMPVPPPSRGRARHGLPHGAGSDRRPRGTIGRQSGGRRPGRWLHRPISEPPTGMLFPQRSPGWPETQVLRRRRGAMARSDGPHTRGAACERGQGLGATCFTEAPWVPAHTHSWAIRPPSGWLWRPCAADQRNALRRAGSAG